MIDTSSVKMHRDGYGPSHPAINVKVHRFGGNDLQAAIVARFACPPEVASKAAEIAYDCQVEDFWRDDADDAGAVAIFGPGVKVYSEGRSDGWLVVHGLPEVEDWTAKDLRKWQKYERQIEAAVKYRCDLANILELIEVNGYHITPVTEEAANLVAC